MAPFDKSRDGFLGLNGKRSHRKQNNAESIGLSNDLSMQQCCQEN